MSYFHIVGAGTRVFGGNQVPLLDISECLESTRLDEIDTEQYGLIDATLRWPPSSSSDQQDGWYRVSFTARSNIIQPASGPANDYPFGRYPSPKNG